MRGQTYYGQTSLRRTHLSGFIPNKYEMKIKFKTLFSEIRIK